MKFIVLIFVILVPIMAFEFAPFCYGSPNWYGKLETDLNKFAFELDPINDKFNDELVSNFSAYESIHDRLDHYNNAVKHSKTAQIHRKNVNELDYVRLCEIWNTFGALDIDHFRTISPGWEQFAGESYRTYVETGSAIYELEFALSPIDADIKRSIEDSRLLEIASISNIEFQDELRELMYALDEVHTSPDFFSDWNQYAKEMNYEIPSCSGAKACIDTNIAFGNKIFRCVDYLNNTECIKTHDRYIPSITPPFGADIEIDVNEQMEKNIQKYTTFVLAYRAAHKYAKSQLIDLSGKLNAISQKIDYFEDEGYESLNLTSQGEGDLFAVSDTPLDFEELRQELFVAKSMLESAKGETDLYKKIVAVNLLGAKLDAIETSSDRLEALLDTALRTQKKLNLERIADLLEEPLHPADAELIDELDGNNESLAKWDGQTLTFLEELEHLDSLFLIARETEQVDTTQLEKEVSALVPGKDSLIQLGLFESKLYDLVDSKLKLPLNDKRKRLIELQVEADVISGVLGVPIEKIEVSTEVIKSKTHFGLMRELLNTYSDEVKRLEKFLKESDTDYLKHLRNEFSCIPQTVSVINEPRILRCSLEFFNPTSLQGSTSQLILLPNIPEEKITDVNVLLPKGVSLSSSKDRLTVKHYVAPHSSKTVIFEYAAQPEYSFDVKRETYFSKNDLVYEYSFDGKCSDAFLRIPAPDNFETDSKYLIDEDGILIPTDCLKPVTLRVPAVLFETVEKNATHTVVRVHNLLGDPLDNFEISYTAPDREPDFPFERVGTNIVWKADIDDELTFVLHTTSTNKERISLTEPVESNESSLNSSQDFESLEYDLIDVQKETLLMRSQLAELDARVGVLKSAAMLVSPDISFKDLDSQKSEILSEIASIETGGTGSPDLDLFERSIDALESELEEEILAQFHKPVQKLSVPDEVKQKVEDTFGLIPPSTEPVFEFDRSKDIVSQFLDSYENVTSQQTEVYADIKKKARASIRSANTTLAQFDKLRNGKQQSEYDAMLATFDNAAASYDAGNYTDALYFALYVYDAARTANDDLKKPSLTVPLILGTLVSIGGGTIAYKKYGKKPKRVFGELR